MRGKKLLDAINVVDVESTCWEDRPPQGMRSEIVEIGICSLRLSDLGIEKKASILVKPVASTVSPFCTKLTTITQEMVDKGIPLGNACGTVCLNYDSLARPWASYGDYDRNQFERNCKALNVSYPFGSRHINVKTLVAAAMGWDCEVGMDEALRRLRMSLVGTHHRAADDASNIAEILCFVLHNARQGMLLYMQ
jgi:inhibitor of KinA sporulation pathway (predicted exonuclease)